jgi:molybdate transport system substrate-binding protein
MLRVSLFAFAVFASTTASAAEIRALSGGAVQESVAAVVQAFEKKTGHKVTIEYAPMGKLQQMLKAGDKAEVLFMTPAALDVAAKDGLKLADGRKALGRSMLGIGIKEGAPVPDISTPEAVKTLIQASKTITYIDPAFGTSGPHVVKMLEQMGIAEEMKPRTKTLPGGRVAELVAKGEADIAIHQIAEIVPVKGVKFVGPLPAAINLISTYMVAATEGASPEAKALAEFAVSPEGAKLVEEGGLTPGGG